MVVCHSWSKQHRYDYLLTTRAHFSHSEFVINMYSRLISIIPLKFCSIYYFSMVVLVTIATAMQERSMQKKSSHSSERWWLSVAFCLYLLPHQCSMRPSIRVLFCSWSLYWQRRCIHSKCSIGITLRFLATINSVNSKFGICEELHTLVWNMNRCRAIFNSTKPRTNFIIYCDSNRISKTEYQMK